MKTIVNIDNHDHTLVIIDSDANNSTEVSVCTDTIKITKYEGGLLRRCTYKISELLAPGFDDRGCLSVNPCDDFIGTQEDWDNRA